MANAADILTDNLDIWTSAIERRSSAGRGRSKKFSLYGIEKLRALILDLAVRGKLVPQDAGDEPASELLKRIAKERAERISRGELRRGKLSADPIDFPFEPPTGWVWLRLAETGNIGSGNSINEPTRAQLASVKEGRPFIATKDVGYGLDRLDYENGLLVEFSDERFKIARKNSVLICAEGGSAGKKIGLADREICFGNKLLANETWSVIAPKFVLLIYMSEFFYHQFSNKMKGVIGGISIANFLELPFPLPPLAEQHRIVSKVDELMGLCDALEAGTYEAIEAHELLVGNLLATLTRSQNAEELAENWARIETHFDTLFTTEASIDQLKQTILQLAVMGKLVQQDRDADSSNQRQLRPDEAAESYDAKAYAARAKKFPLPTGWAIEPLSRVSSHIVDCPHTTPKWTNEGYLCAKSEQIMPGYLDLRNPNYVSEDTFIERIERLKPEPGDILFKREGGILGVACRIPEGTELCLGQRLMLIRANVSMLPPFLELVLNSPWTTDYAREMTTGGAAPRVNMAIVRAFPIPLPPKREQQRILARLTELTDLCELLKVQLSSARAAEVSFADAVASKAVA
jgi:type I restriction enzyme S subunit